MTADDLGAERLDRHLGAGDVLLDQHGRDRRLTPLVVALGQEPGGVVARPRPDRSRAARRGCRCRRPVSPPPGSRWPRRPRRLLPGSPQAKGGNGAPRRRPGRPAGGACPGSAPPRPGSGPGSPRRAAALAVTATKYSELVTIPARAAPSAAARGDVGHRGGVGGVGPGDVDVVLRHPGVALRAAAEQDGSQAPGPGGDGERPARPGGVALDHGQNRPPAVRSAHAAAPFGHDVGQGRRFQRSHDHSGPPSPGVSTSTGRLGRRRSRRPCRRSQASS